MRKNMKLTAGILSLALVAGLMPSADTAAAKKISLSKTKLTLKKGERKTLKVKNAKKKVKWSVTSGKKYIALQNKKKAAVTICGKKKGTAKVQAKAGKKKLYCKVTVKSVTSGKRKDTSSPKPTQTPSVNLPDRSPEVPTVEPSVNPTKRPSKVPPVPSIFPTETPPSTTEKNEQDVVALKALIDDQNAKGAQVSTDINNSSEYTWKNGRLTEICWNGRGLSGDLSFASLTALTQLLYYDGSDALTGLDLSENTALTCLSCVGCTGLTKLDLSENTALTALNCDGCTGLTELDLSANPALISLSCRICTGLTELDLSENTALTYLSCGICAGLTELDLSGNTVLTHLSCSFCRGITEINVTGCTALTDLSCNGCPALTELDVTGCTGLINFEHDSGLTVIGYNK